MCDSAAHATDFTHEAASLSIARHGFGATTVGDLALFAGGAFRETPSSPLELTDVVDIYDTAANAWTTDALSQRRRYVSAASVGSLALFGGGFAYDPDTDTAFYTTAVDLYDSVSHTWTTAALSQPRANPAAVTAGNFVLFGGGFRYDEGYVYSNVVDVFNASNGTWTATTLPTAEGTGIMALAAGGVAIFAKDNTVDVYDPATASWTTTAVPGDRLGIGEAAGNKAVFIGEDGAAVFDATTRQWTFTDEPAAHTGNPLEARMLQSSAVVGEMIVFGGISRCVTYNTATDEWGNPNLYNSSPAYAEAATSLDGKVLFDSQWIWEPQDPPPSTQLDLVRAAWGSCGPEGDLNGDGYVGSADLDIVRANWVAWPWGRVPGLTVFDPETGEWSFGPGSSLRDGKTIALSAGDTALFVCEDGTVDLYFAGGSAVPEPGAVLGLVSLLLAALCGRRPW